MPINHKIDIRKVVYVYTFTPHPLARTDNGNPQQQPDGTTVYHVAESA